MTLLKVEGLTKRFGGVTAVDSLSFEIEAGTIHGLIGPNGSGKTTAINTIAGYYVPTGGRVIFNGHSIGGLPAFKIAKMGIARTFQATKLFKTMTVREHVHVGMTACVGRQKRWNEDELLGLIDLEQYRDEIAVRLPYGVQKRVDLARAVAGNPSLLLLDEPVAGLNESETARVREVIVKLKSAGMTILLVEHHMRLVMGVCDSMTVLNFGRKIAEGKPSDIRTNPLVLEAYLGKEEV